MFYLRLLSPNFASQLAKAMGAGRIVATASSAKHELLKSLGCDEVVDYRTQSCEEVREYSGCDASIFALGRGLQEIFVMSTAVQGSPI